VERIHPENSGIWDPVERPRVEPETVVLGVAWLLAVVQIAIGVLRAEPFGADRAIAVAFAVGCPLLARSAVLGFVKRVTSGLRRP
jgi:hypothetical protein